MKKISALLLALCLLAACAGQETNQRPEERIKKPLREGRSVMWFPTEKRSVRLHVGRTVDPLGMKRPLAART